MRSIFKTALLLAIVLFAGNLSFAQIAGGTYTVGSVAYPTLAATITALNTQGVAGAVTFNLPAGFTETAPTGGYQLGSATLNASLSSSNTLTFQKSGAGANPLITAYTGGTATSASAIQDGIWALNGTDYVTIDGLSLTDPNAANPATMEYGFALYRASATDGSQNNTIKNCTITLNRINNSAQAGPMTEGSAGIIVMDATQTTANANLAITAASGANSNNTFFGNTIQNCNIGVSMTGFAGASPYTLCDQNNTVGGTTSAAGNTIINYGGGGTNQSTGVFMKDQWSFNVSNNTINNNTGAGVNHTGTLRGVWVNTSSLGASGTISANTVTIKGGGTTAQVSAIESGAGSSGTGNTINITNNTITNCTSDLNTTGIWYGIWNIGAATNVNITGNIFTNNTAKTTSAAHYIIYNSGAVSGTLNMSNNSLSQTFNGTAAYTGTQYSLYNSSGTTTTNLTIANNNFSNIIHTTAVGTGAIYYIYNTNSSANLTINANTWTNLTLNHSSSEYLIYNSSSTQVALNVTNNAIVTGYTRTAAAGTMYCYYAGSSSLGTSTQTFSGNNFSNITATTAGTGSFYGLYTSDGVSSPYPRKNIFNNKLSNINYNSTGTFYGIYASYLGDGTSTTGSAVYNDTLSNITYSGTIYTLYTTSTASPTQPYAVYGNVISGITNPSTGGFTYGFYNTGAPAGARFYSNNVNNMQSAQTTGSAIYGMYFSGATNTSVYNNMVSDIRTPAGNSVCPIYGMYFGGGTLFNVYHNTIYLNPASTGTNFGASGIYYAASIGSFDLRNNIVNVNALPAGTGFTNAVRRDGGTTGVPAANFASTSNSNIYYAPNVTSSYLYGEGTALPLINAYNLTNDPGFNTTCALYKAFMTPRESSTFTENNLTQIGTTATYTPSGTSFAKSDAVPTTAPAVTLDYNGVTRANPADVGGLQFTGNGLDAAGPSIGYTALPVTTFCTSNPVFTATITDLNGVSTAVATAPRVYYKKSSEANAFGGANNSTFNGWKWVAATNAGSTFTFTIDYSLLTSAIAVNDSITYFVVAQDLSPTSNVSAVIAAFPTGYCPTSVALPGAAGPLQAAPASYGFRILNGSSVVINATQSQLCISGTTTLSLSPAPNGYTIQWQQDNGTGTFVNIAGATSVSYTTPTLVATNNYRVQLSCGGSLATTTAVKTITVNNPSVATTTPGTRCGVGTVNLAATGSTGSVLNWYAAATGGTALATGPTFTTPVIGATTNYYVSATNGGGTQSFGKLTPTSTTGNTGLTDVGLMFDVTTSTTIQSVDVYAIGTAGTGTLTVALKNSAGTVLQTTTYSNVTISSAGTVATTIPLNFVVPPGTNYRLVANGAVGVTTLIRESTTGYTYPYTIPGVASITSAYTGGASSAYYYYFYNWVVTTGCESARTAVAATVTPPPAITASSPNSPGICTGSTASISVATANPGYSFSWTPGGYNTAAITVSPATTTTYVVTATDISGGANNGCVAKDSVTIAVNPQPGPPTITPATSTICQGSYATLTATPPTSAVLATLGTGTTVNGTTTYPTPFGQYYGSSHEQYIILASELTAQGVSAGNITSLAFNLQSGYTYAALANYSINMGNTSAAAASSTLICSPLTNVYSVASYTPPATAGWATVTFSTPFVWNGTSNVVVDVSFSNCSVCNGTTSCTTSFTSNGIVNQSATPFVSTVNYHYDGNCSINTCTPGGTNITATYSQRPNMQFNASKPQPVNWLNVTGLYKNVTLTTAETLTDTNKTVFASPLTAQSYTAVTNIQGCLSVPSAAVTVNVNPLPNATIAVNPSATICAGQTTTLTAGQTGTGYTYQWTNGGVNIAGATGNTYTTGTAGTYKVIVTNTSTTCAATTATATTVVVNPSPTATATAAGTTTVCNGSSVQLNANTGTGLTYQWLNNGLPITGATSATYFATTTGNYAVMVTNANTCSATSTAVAVLVNTTPAIITPQGTTTFCTGYNVVLQASTGTGFTYVWQLNGTTITGANSSSYTASLSGSYTVIVTNPATTCSSTSSPVVVTVGAPPTSNITPTGTVGVCDGNSFTLTTNTAPGLTYQWYLNGTAIAGANGQTYTRIYTAGAGGGAGAYTANVSSGVGCASTTATPTTITINPLPVVTATAGGATTFCQGITVTLTALPTAGLTYQWYNGATAITGATNNTYVASASGSYTAKATNTNGCVGTSNAINITVNPLPVVSATAATATTFCQGGSVVLNAAPATGLTYQWTLNTTNIPGATASSYTATASGNYTVTATNSNGCASTTTVIPVLVNPLPNVTLTPSGTVNVCSGATTTISVPAAAGQTYQWSNGAGVINGATSASYTTGTAGVYTATVTITATGCQATSAVDNVVVNPLPTAVATPVTSTTACQGDTVKLSANSGTGYTYQWRLNGNSIVGATAQTYNAIIGGTYTVAVTNGFGCTVVSNAIPVNVNPVPAAYITYNTPLSFCQGGAVVLNANAGQGYTYSWLFNGAPIGNTTASTIASQQGNYTIQVTTPFGCSSTSASQNVTVWQVPQPVITMNNYILSTGTYNSYQWYLNGNVIPGATTQSIPTSASGFYRVRVQDIHSCASASEEFYLIGLGVNVTPAALAAIKVYPNPATSIIHVDAPMKLNLVLHDVTGRTVTTVKGAKEIDVAALANGIYMLYINDAEGHTLKVEKVTKTNE